jgi:hypothetical protein
MGSQAMCNRLRILEGSLEKAMHEDVMMKPKLQLRPQDVGDASNMKQLPRKVVGREQS